MSTPPQIQLQITSLYTLSFTPDCRNTLINVNTSTYTITDHFTVHSLFHARLQKHTDQCQHLHRYNYRSLHCTLSLFHARLQKYTDQCQHLHRYNYRSLHCILSLSFMPDCRNTLISVNTSTDTITDHFTAHSLSFMPDSRNTLINVNTSTDTITDHFTAHSLSLFHARLQKHTDQCQHLHRYNPITLVSGVSVTCRMLFFFLFKNHKMFGKFMHFCLLL